MNQKKFLKICTILPVSRINLLDSVITSLINQTHKIDNLIVVYDGDQNGFVEVRNKISVLKLNAICAQSNNATKAFSIPDRRKNIANIHNQIRNMINDADWVFSVEDDGMVPLNALERLLNVANTYDNVGMATGVELGRWGVPYVGAWVVDNVDDVKIITSVKNKTLIEPYCVDEIDACGLYCALIRADQYKKHNFFAHNGLGADVNLGLYLRKLGFKNYIDWGIPITHITNKDDIDILISAYNDASIVELRKISDNVWESRKIKKE